MISGTEAEKDLIAFKSVHCVDTHETLVKDIGRHSKIGTVILYVLKGDKNTNLIVTNGPHI